MTVASGSDRALRVLVKEQRLLCRDQHRSRTVDDGEGILVAQELRG